MSLLSNDIIMTSAKFPPSHQMWAARIALLVHLRMFKEAELEMTAFGELENPDLYYQYHRQSYPGKTGLTGFLNWFIFLCVTHKGT